MIENIRVTRKNGMIERVELLDTTGRLVDELPVTYFSLGWSAGSQGDATFSVHGGRVQMVDA